MKIYYFANNIYQFSYAIPIYKILGGTFLVRNQKCVLQFKWALRKLNKSGKKNGLLNYPNIKLLSKTERQNLSGIIIFCLPRLGGSATPHLSTAQERFATKRYGGRAEGREVKICHTGGNPAE